MRILIIICLFFCSGCLATFQSPLSNPSLENYDNDLTGVWRGNFMGSPSYIHIFKSRSDDKYLDISILVHNELSGTASYTGKAFPTVNKHGYFFNIKADSSNLSQINYVIVKVEKLSNKKIKILRISPKFLSDLINKKLLTGKYEKTKNDVDNVIIYNNSEEILNILDNYQNDRYFYAPSSDAGFTKIDEGIPSIKIPWITGIMGTRT